MNIAPTDLIAFAIVALAAWKVAGALRLWLRGLLGAGAGDACAGCGQCGDGRAQCDDKGNRP